MLVIAETVALIVVPPRCKVSQRVAHEAVVSTVNWEDTKVTVTFLLTYKRPN